MDNAARSVSIDCAGKHGVPDGQPAPVAQAAPVRWLDRLAWIGLAAAPSSLMMGTTTYLSTDVASAPFLWVVPLALYLLTFIIAFQTKPLIGRNSALLLQGAAAAACAYLIPFETNDIALQMFVHLSAFFLTALVCHQALVSRRPPASQLTEFYLWMSVGGVIGGAFNAFLAPVIFDRVLEYPLVLVLAAFANGFAEEVVVVGYLITRLRQLGMTLADLLMAKLDPRVRDTLRG